MNLLYVEVNTFLQGLITALNNMKSNTDTIRTYSTDIKTGLTAAQTAANQMLVLANALDTNMLTPSKTYVRNLLITFS